MSEKTDSKLGIARWQNLFAKKKQLARSLCSAELSSSLWFGSEICVSAVSELGSVASPELNESVHEFTELILLECLKLTTIQLLELLPRYSSLNSDTIFLL